MKGQLKIQLKIQTKQHNDMRNTIATQSEASDHDGYEPIPLELNTPLLNRTQIFKVNEAINHRIDHDSSQHAGEVTVGNTTPVINHTLNSQNPKGMFFYSGQFFVHRAGKFCVHL